MAVTGRGCSAAGRPTPISLPFRRPPSPPHPLRMYVRGGRERGEGGGCGALTSGKKRRTRVPTSFKKPSHSWVDI
eukprot:scaffold109687_cov28-Tisochrysis_lutea.AAC.4